MYWSSSSNRFEKSYTIRFISEDGGEWFDIPEHWGYLKGLIDKFSGSRFPTMDKNWNTISEGWDLGQWNYLLDDYAGGKLQIISVGGSEVFF